MADSDDEDEDANRNQKRQNPKKNKGGKKEEKGGKKNEEETVLTEKEILEISRAEHPEVFQGPGGKQFNCLKTIKNCRSQKIKHRNQTFFACFIAV